MYGTVEGFKTYHTERGRAVAQFDDDDEIAAAMLVASEWFDGKYRSSFPGCKTGEAAQEAEWPRIGGCDIYGQAIPSDSVPDRIDRATYEAAFRQLTTPGSLAVDWTPPKYKSASVDGAVAVQYAQFTDASEVQTRFAVIDQILSPLLTGGGGGYSPLSGYTARA